MTAIAYSRGHKIKWDILKSMWVWADNGNKLDNSKYCKRCGKLPTKEGHDYCIGFLHGYKSACCGHGVEESYFLKEN